MKIEYRAYCLGCDDEMVRPLKFLSEQAFFHDLNCWLMWFTSRKGVAQ